MNLPVVVIVGRPNVGKSSLFNRLIKQRQAIVESQPEITRDRICAQVSWQKSNFILVDTGGLVPKDKETLRLLIFEQTRHAIKEADLVIFLVDGKTGIHPLDQEIAVELKKSKKRVFLVVNKIDDVSKENLIYDFTKLGFHPAIPVSAATGLGTGDLLDVISSNIPQKIKQSVQSISIAIVGKTNVGKSSLFNKILRQKRSIVHHLPGTTRDAVDTQLKLGSDSYIFIDTAGLSLKRKRKCEIEYYSTLRTLQAIKRADVVLLVLDAQNKVTSQDKKIANLILEEKRAGLIILNKWDLIKEKLSSKKLKSVKEEYIELLQDELNFIDYSPLIFTSAVEGEGINLILKGIKSVYWEFNKKIDDSIVNKVFKEAIGSYPPPVWKGKSLKLYSAYQRGIKPPVFILKVNIPQMIKTPYKNYLENKARKSWDFTGSPIRIVFRK